MDNSSNVQTYDISGIDCPICAAGVEKALRETPGLEFSSLDFAAGTLSFDPSQENRVRDILATQEPKAVIRARSGRPSENLRNSLTIFRLSFAGVLLVLGVVFRDFLTTRAPLYWAVFLSAFFSAGTPVIIGAVRGLFGGRIIDELFLMTVASAGAIAIGEVPEAGAVMVFYSVGELLQSRAVSRSRKTIREAMSLRVNFARVVDGASHRNRAPESVEVGTLIDVLPGDFVPLDGRVVSGESWVNTSILTGESLLRRVQTGDEVSAGFVNDEGRFRLRVIRHFEDSAISRVKALLDQASSRKSPTEMILSRFARYYTPIVVGAALLVSVLPPLLLGWSWTESLRRAMVLLVISCPCALVVSVPLAYFASIGRAARDKTLLRGADVLDAVARVDAMVFDKTGTLTEGRFEVRSIHPEGVWTEADLLETAAAALVESPHPIARSIRRAADDGERGHENGEFQEIKGRGVMARISGRSIVAGNAALLREHGVDPPPPAGGGSVVHIAADGVYAGHILLSDAVKPGTRPALAALGKAGVERMIMFTGDREKEAARIAGELGLENYRFELGPEEKMRALEELIAIRNPKTAVVFVGDGLNDAPSILRADVGMAMGGSGTDLAIEAADAVFMDDNPMRICQLLETARFTRRTVLVNIVFSLGIKVALMVSGVFYGIPLWVAVLGDVGVTLLAVLNSLRVLRRKLPSRRSVSPSASVSLNQSDDYETSLRETRDKIGDTEERIAFGPKKNPASTGFESRFDED